MVCFSDIVCDLSFGDCGKGCVVHHLLKSGDYTHVVRHGGGHNAGHSIIHEGKKIITHIIPAGVFFGVRSVVGPGCVINPSMFLEEIEYLEQCGIDARKWVKVAKNAHVITDQHLREDYADIKIGTTKKGNGPAYRDKYDRTGIRAEDCPELEEFLIDMYQEMYPPDGAPIVLFEGAQGFGLDIDFGDYPFVTSSHCIAAGALLSGVAPQSVRHVYGVIKPYETYVGAKDFHGQGELFDQLREVGGEYGATTGRPRQCNYLNIDMLKKAIKINGVDRIVINKMDVLQELGVWRIRNDHGEVLDFSSERKFKSFLIRECFSGMDQVFFSYSPDGI